MHLFAWSPNPYAPKSYRRGPMVTPVHRFPRIESMLISPRGRLEAAHGCGARGRRWGNRPRLGRAADQISSQSQSSTSEVPRVHETNIENGNHTEDSISTASHRPTLPDNFNRFSMGGINWSVWVCLIIVTGLLVPAHVFLKTHSYRGEIMVVLFICTLMFLMCFSVSMFHSKTRDILLHRLHMEEAREDVLPESQTDSSRSIYRAAGTSSHEMRSDTMRSFRGSRSSPDLQLNGVSQTNEGRSQRVRVLRSMSQASRASAYIGMLSNTERCASQQLSDNSGEPPPYEVALLLPVPSPTEPERYLETPPPPYDVLN